MIADFMPPLYVAALYGASRLVAFRGNPRQGVVLDAIAVNWLACSIVREVVEYPNIIVAYMMIDIVTAFWLASKVRGKCSGIAEGFYLAQILFSAAYFFKDAFDSMTHWTGLSILSWGQLMAVTGGIMRNELRQALDRISTRLGVQRYLAFGDRKDDK